MENTNQYHGAMETMGACGVAIALAGDLRVAWIKNGDFSEDRKELLVEFVERMEAMRKAPNK